MKKLSICLVLMWCICSIISAQKPVKGEKNNPQKTYEEYVVLLRNGDTKIDYTDFRHSYHASNKIMRQLRKQGELKAELNGHLEGEKMPEAIETLHKLLDIDFTNIETHIMLSSIYEYTGKDAKSKHHNEIARGLLESIMGSGDGKSPETAWKVIQVPEEYMILLILGAKPVQQSLTNTEPVCDMIEATIDGQTYTFYFDISKVMELYARD